MSSGIFNAFLGFGQVLAPMYGSATKDALGFRLTSDIVAIICLVFGIAYFLLGGGIEAFTSTARNLTGAGKRSDTADSFERASTTPTVVSHVSLKTAGSGARIPVPTPMAVSRMRLKHLSSRISGYSNRSGKRSNINTS